MNKFLIRGLRKTGLLKRINFGFKKTINKQKYYIPILSGNGQQNAMRHEEWMGEVLQLVISLKSGAFIDVGANVGQTLLKVKSVDPNILYYGFEPHPTCIYYLNELIEHNRIGYANLFPVAVSDEPGIARLNFYYDSDTDSAASIIPDFKLSGDVLKTVFIPCFPMDYFQEFIDSSKVGTVKIDVEGAELEVLKGVKSFLIKSRPYIIVEVLPVYNEKNNVRLQRQTEIETILRENEYCIVRILKTSDNHLASFECINTIGIHSVQEWCDYIFCPNESVHHFINYTAK